VFGRYYQGSSLEQATIATIAQNMVKAITRLVKRKPATDAEWIEETPKPVPQDIAIVIDRKIRQPLGVSTQSPIFFTLSPFFLSFAPSLSLGYYYKSYSLFEICQY